MSLTTLSLTLCYLFIHSSQLEFQNLDFFMSRRNLHHHLWFMIWNSKIRYHTATLWAFYCMCWLMSLTTLSLTLCYLWIHSSQLEFRNVNFFIPCGSLHRKIWLMLFNSKIRYHKATLWGFIACGGSCLSLSSILHNITLPFHSLRSARVSVFRFFHLMS
mgnify:CR=1 FL=1